MEMESIERNFYKRLLLFPCEGLAKIAHELKDFIENMANKNGKYKCKNMVELDLQHNLSWISRRRKTYNREN
jgi:hypothetical protein